MMKSPSPIEPVARTSPPDATRTRIREHLLAGWARLAFIVVTGLLLEGLHALKVDAYLLPSNETRRMMWRLAHSHGGLLCLLQLGFAGTLALVPQPVAGSRRLHVATVLIPG